MIPLTRPTLLPEARAGIARCVAGHWLGYGPRCRELETAFLGSENAGSWALATSSCTAALHVAARLCLPAPGDEVIVPAITFVSAAMAFACAGFTVRFADVDAATGLPTLDGIAARLTLRTRAVVAVHLYGQRADCAALRVWCDRHGLALIEDCAHRLDLLDAAPQTGDFACFSFNAMKEIPCGEGGLLRGRDPTHEPMARAISNAGLNVDPWQRSAAALHPDYGFTEHIGMKVRLNDVLASLATPALPHLGAMRAQRHDIFQRYRELLAPLAPELAPLRTVDERDACLMFVARVGDGAEREILREALARAGIASSVHYPSLTRHRALNIARDACPEAEALDQKVFTLPCHLELSQDDQAQVAAALTTALRGRTRTTPHRAKPPPAGGVLLAGEQIVIGWPTPEECDAITTLRNSERVRRWFVDSRPLEPAANRQWLVSGMNRAREAVLAIRCAATGAFLGVCGWSELDVVSRTITLGRFALDLTAVKAAQARMPAGYRGTALDAALSVRDWVFRDLGVERVRSTYLVRNSLAARVNRAMGLEPVRRTQIVSGDGRSLEVIHLEMSRARWEEIVRKTP